MKGLPRVETFDGFAGTAGHHRMTMGAALDVAAALRECASGERVTWDVGLQLVPTPQGPRPMVMIYLQIPAAVIGELCAEIVMIEPKHVNPGNITRNMRGAMERLRQARAASTTSSPHGR